MQKEIKFKAVGKYAGHQVKPNKSVDLGIKFSYDQLPNTVNFLQLFNENIDVYYRNSDKKAIKLGSFMLKSFGYDHDGEATLKLNSMTDYVETNTINELISDDLFIFMFKAIIESENDEEEE